MRRPAATARSICSRPCVSTRPPGSKTRIFRRCGYSAATRPRLSHMPARTSATSVCGKLGQGAGDVEPGAFGNAEPRADRPCQRAADGRGPIERQQPERAKAQRRSPALQPVGKRHAVAGRPNIERRCRRKSPLTRPGPGYWARRVRGTPRAQQDQPSGFRPREPRSRPSLPEALGRCPLLS